MRYTVRLVPTPVNAGMYQVHDALHDNMIGKMYYFEGDAEKVAVRLNAMDPLKEVV